MEARWITDWTPSSRFPHYTRANAGEVLPTPASPLGQQVVWERGICLGWRDRYVRQGLYTLDELDPAHPDVCGASTRIGALIEVDADRGTVTMLEVPA